MLRRVSGTNLWKDLDRIIRRSQSKAKVISLLFMDTKPALSHAGSRVSLQSAPRIWFLTEEIVAMLNWNMHGAWPSRHDSPRKWQCIVWIPGHLECFETAVYETFTRVHLKRALYQRVFFGNKWNLSRFLFRNISLRWIFREDDQKPVLLELVTWAVRRIWPAFFNLKFILKIALCWINGSSEWPVQLRFGPVNLSAIASQRL